MIEQTRQLTKCIICGKDIPEKRQQQGKLTCCRGCATSYANQRNWQKSEFRDKTSKSIKASRSTKESREKTSKATAESWKHQERRDKFHASMTTIWANQEYKEHQSNKLKERWLNDAYRDSMTAQSKERWANSEYKMSTANAIKASRSTKESREKTSALWPESHIKAIRNRKLSGTLKMSKEERYVFDTFNSKGFGLSIIEHWNVPYPNHYKHCDFYIPQLELWIEGHFNTFMHYTEPYDSSNAKHKERLLQLLEKAKDSCRHAQAVHQWTIDDIWRKQYAESLNLNWIAFYTIEQFNKWFSSIRDLNYV